MVMTVDEEDKAPQSSCSCKVGSNIPKLYMLSRRISFLTLCCELKQHYALKLRYMIYDVMRYVGDVHPSVAATSLPDWYLPLLRKNISQKVSYC